jgi:hypothetical protein
MKDDIPDTAEDSLVSRVFYDQANVVRLGEFDTCCRICCGAHIDSVVDIISLQAGALPRCIRVATRLLLICSSKSFGSRPSTSYLASPPTLQHKCILTEPEAMTTQSSELRKLSRYKSGHGRHGREELSRSTGLKLWC